MASQNWKPHSFENMKTWRIRASSHFGRCWKKKQAAAPSFDTTVFHQLHSLATALIGTACCFDTFHATALTHWFQNSWYFQKPGHLPHFYSHQVNQKWQDTTVTALFLLFAWGEKKEGTVSFLGGCRCRCTPPVFMPKGSSKRWRSKRAKPDRSPRASCPSAKWLTVAPKKSHSRWIHIRKKHDIQVSKSPNHVI